MGAESCQQTDLKGKYVSWTLSQKTVGTSNLKIRNGGLMSISIPAPIKPPFSDETFLITQQEKLNRTKNSENTIAIDLTF